MHGRTNFVFQGQMQQNVILIAKMLYGPAIKTSSTVVATNSYVSDSLFLVFVVR